MTREEAIAELNVLHERLSNPKNCEDGCYSWEDGWYVEAIDMAIEALQDRPAGEWIEVVRCKDCKYSKHLKQYPKVNTWKCILTDVVYRADDYCSYGERKEECLSLE